MPINHKVIGDGYPVVMLHGWTLDHQAMLHCMEPVFEKRKGWKRIYVDLPGMGRSEPQHSIRNSDEMLGAVLHFLDHLIPNERFVVCGYSYGALIARGIAHLRRNLVRGLLLFAPVIVAEPAERVLPEPQILRKDPALMSRLSAEDAAEFESIAVLQGEQEWEKFREEILIPSKSASHEFLDQIRQNGYGFTFDIDRNSPPFEHPTLVITGRQDHVVGFQDAWRLMDYYLRATFAVLDMAGHNLQIERPNIFEALVNDWLDRLESGL
ncbi:alpha/beta fold hydrolase [Alicyclobacillus kakegawensis]|uniref:alpha/beta fold hydrolase n=1 Tax=Alicyclobacillus kakegawensis TaxID=392012 RepID=UPI0008315441|nr:alpha/beta hydrolase [Alicyclobacillus kakegawensis]